MLMRKFFNRNTRKKERDPSRNTNMLLKIAELKQENKELSKLVEVLALTRFISRDDMLILEELVKLFNE